MENDDIVEEDLVQMIRFKNHLITYSPEELIDIYGTKDMYLYFLDMIVVLSKKDYGFLLLDDRIIESIRKVLEVRKDEYKDGINHECINSIIRLCNHIDNIDRNGKNLLITQYLLFQSDARGIDISSVRNMFTMIIYDSLVYDAIIDEDFSKLKSEPLLLSSLMYLSIYTPGIFQNENHKKLIMDELNNICKKAGIFEKKLKKYVKEVTGVINNVNQKKEE